MAGNRYPFMTTPPPNRPFSELEQQLSLTSEEIRRLADVSLNCLFALTPGGARRRRFALRILLLLAAMGWGLYRLDRSAFIEHARNLFVLLLDPAISGAPGGNPGQALFELVLLAYWDGRVIQFLLILGLASLVARRLAAIYLADIFEINDISTARKFIIQVALTGSKETIRISGGDVASESERSPVHLIGGPGSVIVELDSAALFEWPDGRPHVIGPTTGGPVVLDAFERFRQAIDLRDHRTESLSISSRSRDGLPIHAADVSFIFSVARAAGKAPSAQQPYTFLGRTVIESLVYKQAARVTTQGPRPAELSKAWAGTMTGLIRSTLGEFMSQRNLTEYLASFGTPEVVAAHAQANAVNQSAQRVLPPEGPVPILSTRENAPEFTPRPVIRENLFGVFARTFPSLAIQRGVSLHWVGIGTWKTPTQIIPDQHLEAWQLSMDNQARRSAGTPDHRSQYVLAFIQDVPLTRFAQSGELGLSHDETMVRLLVGYREQFMKILYLLAKREDIGADVGDRVLRALYHLNRVLGWPDNFPAHWVRGDPPGN